MGKIQIVNTWYFPDGCPSKISKTSNRMVGNVVNLRLFEEIDIELVRELGQVLG